MLRKLSLSILVVLLLSSGALAIGHTQGFSLAALNLVERIGCVGSAEGSNIAMVGHAQEAYNVASGIAAYQEETAILTQSGSTVGSGGVTVITQDATADGAQSQFVGVAGNGIGSQSQSLSVNLDNLLSNTSGIGGAVGAQGFVGAQNQTEITPNGMSTTSQVVGAAQFSAVSGRLASVNNSLNVVLNQSQNVAPAP